MLGVLASIKTAGEAYWNNCLAADLGLRAAYGQDIVAVEQCLEALRPNLDSTPSSRR